MPSNLAGFHLTSGFLAGACFGAAMLLWANNILITFFLALPGLLAHELAHFGVAFVMRASPRSLQLFPRKTAPGLWVLGQVTFVPHWFSAGFVALAPLYLLPLLVWVAYRQALGAPLLAQVLWGYFAIVLCWEAPPSSVDWAVALRFPLGTVLVLTLIVACVSKFVL